MRPDFQTRADEWDRFVVAHADGHLLQTSAWGELKSEFGWHAERIAVRDGERIVAGAQVLYRRLPLGFRIAYVPKGPLVDLADVETCQVLFAALHRQCRSRRAVMLKIEPDLQTAVGPPTADAPCSVRALSALRTGPYRMWLDCEAADLRALLGGYGFQPGAQTIQPRRTILIDLTSEEDEILRRMKGKTRYNIRLAERKGVRVHSGGEEDVSAFARLMAITGERNAFGIHTPTYYERAYALFVPSGAAHLFMATYRNQPIAGLMAFACGQKSWYMYGASGNEHRDKMPNYALQWAAIRWARVRGCRTYDLWGAPDEDEETLEARFADRHDGLWGVYRFKRGFGGQLVRYVGAFDYVYNGLLYWLYHRALQVLGNHRGLPLLWQPQGIASTVG